VRRPFGVTALSLFLIVGALLAGIAAVSLAVPDSTLEPMWRLNPRSHQGLVGMRGWGVLLLCIASIGCGIAGTGLWRCRAWGHATAIVVLCIQLAGDILNVISGTEPRAVIGIPIVAALLVYLTRASVRRLFWSQAPG
jgi:hypothetical protein